MKIISVDTGHSNIKTLHHEFPAGLADAAGIAEEIIKFGDKQYAVSHRRIPYLRDKTTTKQYLVLTLFALARELGDSSEPIVLAVGLPPAHYQSLRNEFEKYFRGKFAFEYNGKIMTANIERVLVFPQAYAAAMTRASELKGKDRAFIIDIGGMTVDTLLLRNAVPDMAYTMSIEGGVNRLLNDTTAALAAQLGVKAEQDHVEAVLRGKDNMLSGEAKTLIENKARAYTEHLLADLRERDVDLTTTQAVFAGGGALLLRRFFEASNLVNRPIFIESANANAQGYQLLAEALMRK